MFADKALAKTNEVAVVKAPGNLVFTYPQLIAIGTVVISTALCALFLIRYSPNKNKLKSQNNF
jgi:hypothetical protein